MPCKRGTREQVEEGKRRREQERAYEQSAERKYWLDLVRRVHDPPLGIDSLSEAEKFYYSVNCLVGEVYNGGFEQFFSNSSGSLYGLALTGLFELEAEASASLLVQAKEALFGSHPVPIEQEARVRLMPTIQNDDSPVHEQLEQLDKKFYADPDSLAELCKAYAAKHQLYADG